MSTERRGHSTLVTEKKLLLRDAKRDIGAELLASVLEMKAGKKGRVHQGCLTDKTKSARWPGKTATLEEGRGLARYKGPPISIKEMNEGVRDSLRRR